MSEHDTPAGIPAGIPTFPLSFHSRLRMATDGQGVTALVGAHGCPLCCRMCLNPSTWDGTRAMRRVTPTELYDLVKQDSLYYLATGGGVTFGGGEPLLHARFIEAFRGVCHPDWRIYAESCLHIPAANIPVVARVVDHFFIDIKDMNPAIYKAYTGQDNTPVKENLRALLALTAPDRITVRVPHIPGFNTDRDVEASLVELRGMGLSDFDVFWYREPKQTSV